MEWSRRYALRSPGRAGGCDHLVHCLAFSSLLVAIQVASAQLTPRIIATTLLRDWTIRSVVALFVLTLSFGLMTLARSQTDVQYLLLSCAVALGAASTAAFIYLIDYAARLLRPVSIRVAPGGGGAQGHRAGLSRKDKGQTRANGAARAF